MSNTMRALVFRGPGDMRVESVRVPRCGPGQILVRVRAAGICGTDLRIYRNTKKIPAPRILGHEFAGEVAEIGSGVADFAHGDWVTVYPMLACGECYCCKAGRSNICVNRTTIGYEIDGGFAEYVLIPAKAVVDGNVIKLPPNITWKEAAASEPVAAAYNGIQRAKIRPGDDVVLLGGGPIGLYHAQLARLTGAGRVIVSEPSAERRERAKALGADYLFDPSNQDATRAVFDLTGGKGANVAFIDVGIPAVVKQGLKMMKKGGTCVLFAGCAQGDEVTIDPNWIHYREIDLIGSSSSSPIYHRAVLSLIASGHLDVRSTISHELTLEEWQKGFEMKGNAEGMKTVLYF